jgi:DNA excision repair protein ERCC-2
MPVRFDPNKKELVVGVRDLAAAIAELEGVSSDSLASGGGYLPGRGSIGGQIHRITQEEAGATDPQYHREVFLKGNYRIDDYTVSLQGRLDALYRRDDVWIAQEIKTVAVPPHIFERLSIDSLTGFRNQLLIYLHLLHSRNGSTLIDKGNDDLAQSRELIAVGELLLVNLYDRKHKALPVIASDLSVSDLVHEGLGWILRGVLEEHARKQNLKRLSRKVRFPHRAYRPFQKEMVGRVRDGIEAGRRVLLSAPTGSGKTAAALTPTLRHALKNGHRLFIVTSKTTQQWLIWKSLQLFRDHGVPFRAVLLRAKEKLCPEPVMICHESVCKYCRDLPIGSDARDMYSRIWEYGMVDADVVTAIALEYEVCPFELSLALAYQADVIVGDYNYVFDPAVSLQRLQPEDWSNTILLVDEIHNLYQRGRDIFSPELPRSLITRCRKELVGHRSRSDIPTSLIRGLGKWLNRLDKQFRELAERGQLEYPGMSSHLVELDKAWWQELADDLESLIVRYLLEIRIRELFPQENPLLELYWALSRFVGGFSLEDDTYRIALDNTLAQRLKIYCLDPSGPIGALLNRSRAVVGLSATLQPVEFFMTVLGLDEMETDVLSFPSAFPPENRLMLVIGSVSTRYRFRQQFATEIGDIISRIVAGKPGNYLVFFPSYSYLRMVEPHVKSPGFRRVIQEPGLTEEQRVLIMRVLTQDQPVLMFSVQGGIFSEGMDYPGKSLIGGIVIGPGLPQVSFETELLREYYDRTRSQGFEFAYLYPGMSRVIQSAGRVIRSPEDRGIIILVGERFTKPQYTDLFPSDWYDRHPEELNISDWEKAIDDFWATEAVQ